MCCLMSRLDVFVDLIIARMVDRLKQIVALNGFFEPEPSYNQTAYNCLILFDTITKMDTKTYVYIQVRIEESQIGFVFAGLHM